MPCGLYSGTRTWLAGGCGSSSCRSSSDSRKENAMKSGAQVGLAIAAGYVLGRFHKMKLALGLAAVAGGKRFAGSKGDHLRQGAKLVKSSPELSNLTGDLRGRLVDAGKSAAPAAVRKKNTP